MLHKIAQELADSISQAIDCEVAIIDKDSIIVGASDISRLGLFNEGSLEVIRTGKPLLHRPGYIEHMQNTKPGHCFPLLLSGEVIGAVGIAGVKDEVKKYAQLVQSLAEVVMKEAMNQVTRISENYAHQDLIQSISNLEPTRMNEEILMRKGFELGVDLRYAHIPIAVDLAGLPQLNGGEAGEESSEVMLQMNNGRILRRVDHVFSDRNDICAFTAHDKILILFAFSSCKEEKEMMKKAGQKCAALRKLLKEEGVEIMCGVGTACYRPSKLRESCRGAWLVLGAASRLKKVDGENRLEQWLFFMKDYFVETLMIDSSDGCMNWFQERHLSQFFRQSDVDELIRTVRCWCESGFKYTKAAEMLFIHRNTLMYRLKKIENLCGVSAEEPRQMFALYLAILRTVLTSTAANDEKI